MKNVAILFYPPFRGNIFPVDYLQNLNGYRFFLFMIDADAIEHQHFIGKNNIESIISTELNFEKLISLSDAIQEKYGDLDNILYLSEECVQVCGNLRKYFGVAEENLDRYIQKDMMMEILSNKNISTPKSIVFDEASYQDRKQEYIQEIETQVSYPLFVKPTNSMGSVDTSLFKKQSEFTHWANHKDNQTYLIQEYLEGTLYHCESFIQNKKILYTSVFEYSNPGFFFSLGFPVGSISLPRENEFAQQACDFIESIITNLGIIENGIIHIEFFKNKRDDLIFLEAAARPPGLVGDLLYRKHLNISIDRAHLLLQLGEYDQDISQFRCNYYAARYIFPIPTSGCINQILPNPKLDSDFTQSFRVKLGDVVSKSQNLFNVSGTMVLWNKDYESLRDDFQKLKNHNPIVV